MQCPNRGNTTDEEINTAIDRILEEDQRENLRSKNQNCSKERKNRHTGIEKSKRFSIRVMEAIRAIQQEKEKQLDSCTTAADVYEIVDYIDKNFDSNGDLDAQVQTSLKRTCYQGFVKNEGNNSYRLVGPLACQLTRTKISNNRSFPNFTSRRGIHDNPPNDHLTEESSEIEFSTILENDEDRNKKESNINKTKQNSNTYDVARVSNRNKKTNFERKRNNRWLHSTPLRNKSTSSSHQSSEDNEDTIVGTILNPAQEIEIDVNLPDFEDDDDYENDIESTTADAIGINKDEKKQELTDDEDGEDGASDDSVLHELKNKNARPSDKMRDRELKRWIRSCRRECAKRALKDDFSDN